MSNPIKIGIGGPVGAGKTQLIEKVVKRLAKKMSIGVITNDIYTKEDEKILVNTCLLYTSPSPRDQRGSRMPSSA